MYVRFMVPQGGDGNVPVVMVHGATLTGKSWETTSDGRMGWDVYFVRRGPVYEPPLWVKGMGELGMVGIPAAIANAVFHATGRRIRELPITPDKLL